MVYSKILGNAHFLLVDKSQFCQILTHPVSEWGKMDIFFSLFFPLFFFFLFYTTTGVGTEILTSFHAEPGKQGI